MGVVVRRYIYILIRMITFPHSTCIGFFKMFIRSCSCYLCNIANVAQRLYRQERGKYVDCAQARVPRLPRAEYAIPCDISRKLPLTCVR